MRRKIQNLIQGKFEYDQPALIIREDMLRFQVVENEVYTGAFHIESSTDVPVRGLVSCEDAHIHILTKEFDAVSAEIAFEYDGSEVTEGDTAEGCFVICSNVGEYILDYTVKMTRHYLATSIGKIKTLNDFSNLSNLNWEEALKVFSSPHFTNIFHEKNEYYTLLYRGLTQSGCTPRSMEEFLIAIGKKRRSQFVLFEDEKLYHVNERMIPDSVRVMKSEWGYCDIALSCDAPFISLKKNRLSMYDFRGKHANVSWQLLPSLMHKGKNYAVITLENNYQKEQITITAIKGEPIVEHSIAHRKRSIYVRLEKKFLDYLMENLTADEWKTDSLKLIEQMHKVDPDNRWMDLFAAYICLKTADVDRAEEYMMSMPRNIRNGRTPQGAFYDYLTVLADEEYDNDMEDVLRIRQIQQRYPKHPILFWILLQMDQTLNRNPQRKYQAIRKYMEQQSGSPVFYLEAANILIANPEILSNYGAYEFRLIRWMSRKNLITYDLALRIQGMAGSVKTFDQGYYRLLTKCYKKYPDSGFVKVICTYLIKTSRYGEAYFPWFKRGLENHLRIAGLYEGYMLSWSRSQGELPPEILKYFSMSNSLPTQRKAMLFAYIVRNKRRLGKDWPAYMVMVKNFAIQQLEKGNVSEDLAVIYEELRRTMHQSEWNDIKKESESCYRIRVKGDRWAAVRVMQNVPQSAEHRAILYHNQAYVYLYKRPFIILYEDLNGIFYAAGDDYHINKVLSGNSLLTDEKEAAAAEEKQSAKEQQISDKERLEHMAGPIDEMAGVLLRASQEGYQVLPFAQQLMIRMLFTGYLPSNHNAVFHLIKEDPESADLADAYATVISRSLLIYEYPMHQDVFDYIARRLHTSKKMNSFCRAAFLQEQMNKKDTNYRNLETTLFESYLFEGKYFGFYEKLSLKEKRRYLLTNLRVVSVLDAPGKTFFIEFSASHKESLQEAVPGLYTYPVRMSPGDALEYRIVDIAGMTIQSGTFEAMEVPKVMASTRYGRLSALDANDPDANEEYEYAKICDMTEALFLPIKE